MSELALTLTVTGRRAVLVGGGRVAARKARVLLEAGMALTVVAPVLEPSLAALAQAGGLAWFSRCYQRGDLSGAFLVVAATDQRSVNQQVAEDARELGLLVTVADAPQDGNCAFPALLQRGGLRVAVSTAGGSPAFAAAVRDELSPVLDEAYGEALELLTGWREKLLTLGAGHTYNVRLIKELLAAGLVDLLRQGNRAAAEDLIRRFSALSADRSAAITDASFEVPEE